MKAKIFMLLLLVFIVSINATEEALHEYLACLFVLLSVWHLLGQGWWLSMGRQIFGASLRLKSAMAIIMAFSAVLTLLSGLLISRYAFPFFKLPHYQSVLIELHHTAAFTFFVLCSFHFGLHLSFRKLCNRRVLKGAIAAFALSGLAYLVSWAVDNTDLLYSLEFSEFSYYLICFVLPVMFCSAALSFGALTGRFTNRRTVHA